MSTQLSDNPIRSEQKIRFAQNTFRHYGSGTDLLLSAENGCHLCTLLCYKLHHLQCQEGSLESSDWSQFDLILDIVVILKYNPFDEDYLLLPTIKQREQELCENFDILALRELALVLTSRRGW